MPGQVRIVTEQLRNTANEFVQVYGQVKTTTNQMVDIIKGLNATWQGEASNAFIGKFAQLEDDMMRILRMIDEHQVDLNDIAREFELAEQENVATSSGLAGDVIS